MKLRISPRFGGIVFITTLFVFSSPSPFAFAQEANITPRWSISWEECLGEAYHNHPKLVAAREAIRSALADRNNAVGTYLPNISAGGSETVTKSPHVKHTYGTSYDLSYSQLIFDSFKTPADILEQNRLLDGVREAYRSTSSQILYELRSSFVELMRSRKLVDITEDIAKRRQINVNLVSIRYDAGRENKGSLLRTEANLAQAEFEIEQAKRTLRVNQRKLNQALGRVDFSPLLPDATFDGEKIDDTMEFELEPVLDRHPSLQQVVQTRKSKRWDVVSKWAAFFPTFNLTLSEQISGEEWHAIQSHAWSVLVKGSVPLFNGGATIFNLSKAKAAYQAALADEHSERDSVVIGVESQWASTLDAIQFVEVQRKFLEASDLRAQIMATQYASGTVSFEDWDAVEDSLVNARKAYLNAQRDAFIAYAQWLRAKGVGFEDILPKSQTSGP